MENQGVLTLLHSERPKLYTILASLSAIGLISKYFWVNMSTSCFINNDDLIKGIGLDLV